MTHDPSPRVDPQRSRSTSAPTRGSGWVDLTGDQRATWGAYWVFLGLFLGLPLALATIPAYQAAASGDGETMREYGYALALVGTPLLVLGGLLVATAPRYLTHQGVEVSQRGIAVVKRSKWWFRGGTGFVPWSDVGEVAWGLRKGRGARRTLEVHLGRLDHALRLPARWARLVPAGEEKWGSTASRPRIIFDLDRKILDRIREELAVVRPDLVEVPGERAASTARSEARPEPSEEEPATAETEPATRRVNMRWQGALGWAVTTVFCLYLTFGLTVATVVLTLALRETGEIGAATMMLALALFFGLLSWPLVRMAPRYSTRQGISVDGAGITLTQEPNRWFPGRSARIPWSQVRQISQDAAVSRYDANNRGVQYVIDIELPEPFHDTKLPTWAGVVEERVRIRPSRARHTEIVQALRAVRPDLFS